MRKPKGLFPNAGMKCPRPNNNEMPNKRPRMNNATGDDNKRSFYNGNNMRFGSNNNKEGTIYKSYAQRNFGFQQNMYNRPPNANFDQNVSQQYPPVHAAPTFNNHYQQQQMQFPQFAFTSYPPPALPKN